MLLTLKAVKELWEKNDVILFSLLAMLSVASFGQNCDLFCYLETSPIPFFLFLSLSQPFTFLSDVRGDISVSVSFSD